jgi:hypothetical protein
VSLQSGIKRAKFTETTGDGVNTRLLDPYPEERPLGRVSKDDEAVVSWFETREDALLTMRV